jgi:hypothetical protein
MITPELKEVEGKLAATQAKVKSIFDEAGPDFDMSKVKCLGDSADVVAEIRKLNDEAASLGLKHAELTAMKTAVEFANGTDWSLRGESLDDGRRSARKSFAEAFVKSKVRLGGLGTREEFTDVDVKTLFQRSAGWAPESIRDAGYVPAASAPLMVTDLIPVVPTRQAAVKYMEQTTRTNNAAERAEGGAYGEAAIELTERSVTVETVGVWLPYTDEQVEDEDEAMALMEMDLPLMVRQRLDGQILVGDGSTPNILGVNNKPSIQTQAKGADPVFDAILKASTKVRVTGRATPNAVVFHPNDWQDLRLTRTADGIYILGNPNEAGPSRIWGLVPIESDNQTENTAGVGDFANHARLRLRRDVVVEKTNSHDTNFINGRQAIRAGIRCATVWNRAAAFCTVTGI